MKGFSTQLTKGMTMKEKCDTCHKELLCGEVYFCVGCSAIEAATAGPVHKGELFSDMELQWFHGFPTVADVGNVTTEDDTEGEECGCGEQTCFWCCDTQVGMELTDNDIPF